MRGTGTEVSDGGKKLQGPYAVLARSPCSSSSPGWICPLSPLPMQILHTAFHAAPGVSHPQPSAGSFIVFWELISFSPEQVWICPTQPRVQSSPCPGHSADREAPKPRESSV